jgi:hypothetical protein
MLTGVTGLDQLEYQSNDAITLTCTFRCDYWDDEIAAENNNYHPLRKNA